MGIEVKPIILKPGETVIIEFPCRHDRRAKKVVAVSMQRTYAKQCGDYS